MTPPKEPSEWAGRRAEEEIGVCMDRLNLGVHSGKFICRHCLIRALDAAREDYEYQKERADETVADYIRMSNDRYADGRRAGIEEAANARPLGFTSKGAVAWDKNIRALLSSSEPEGEK